MNTKEEAEMLWDDYDNDSCDGWASQRSREAYKSALREAIEERQRHLLNAVKNEPMGVQASVQSTVNELGKVLNLLDTVNPKDK